MASRHARLHPGGHNAAASLLSQESAPTPGISTHAHILKKCSRDHSPPNGPPDDSPPAARKHLLESDRGFEFLPQPCLSLCCQAHALFYATPEICKWVCLPANGGTLPTRPCSPPPLPPPPAGCVAPRPWNTTDSAMFRRSLQGEHCLTSCPLGFTQLPEGLLNNTSYESNASKILSGAYSG